MENKYLLFSSKNLGKMHFKALYDTKNVVNLHFKKSKYLLTYIMSSSSDY